MLLGRCAEAFGIYAKHKSYSWMAWNLYIGSSSRSYSSVSTWKNSIFHNKDVHLYSPCWPLRLLGTRSSICRTEDAQPASSPLLISMSFIYYNRLEPCVFAFLMEKACARWQFCPQKRLTKKSQKSEPSWRISATNGSLTTILTAAGQY